MIPSMQLKIKIIRNIIYMNHSEDKSTSRKALTIMPEFAEDIALGQKTVEVRTWKTNYRGPLLITSSSKRCKGLICGYALCVVDLIDVVPMTKELAKKALVNWRPEFRDTYAWILDNNRLITPQPVKGKLSIWECDCPIEYHEFKEIQTAGDVIELEVGDFFEKYWQPITC